MVEMPIMKRAQYEELINQIIARLDEISKQDRAVIQPSSEKPIEITVKQLFEYGERHDERVNLHDELRRLASEPIED